MASKTVYQNYNEDALKHFSLENQPKYGLVTSDKVEDVLITQDQTTFEKIHDLFEYNTSYPNKSVSKILSGYKKVFVLPRCPVSLDRIKASCREHNITVTNDYTKADCVITHETFYQKFSSGEKIKVSTLMYRLWNYEAYNNANGYWDLIDKHPNPVIYDEKWESKVSSWSLREEPISLYDEWGIPGLALNLAHLIDTNQLDVLDVNDVLSASANVTILTKSLIDDISKWLDSNDKENKTLLGKILPTIDYIEKPHLVWELAQNIYHKLYYYTKDKDVKYWLAESNLEKLYHFSAQDMILYLEREERLETESFRYLEPHVRRNISIQNRDLYTFKVNVKEEYKKYLK